MSHPLIPAVAQGAECILKLVEAEIESARHYQAPDALLAFEGTMFPLPLADALLGREGLRPIPTIRTVPSRRRSGRSARFWRRSARL